MQPVLSLPHWDQDKEAIAERIRTRHGFFKIILKTLDEPIFIEHWITHHADIVGLQNLIIADNGSTDPRVLETYASFGADLVVFQFKGFHNNINDRRTFRPLYDALSVSARYVAALDTDEFLVLLDQGEWRSGLPLAEWLEELSPDGLVPCTWLQNYPGERHVYRCTAGDLAENVRWGKPVTPASFLEGGFLIHNQQFPAANYRRPIATNLFLLHQTRLSKEQRLRTNRNKLVARKFISPATSYEDIVALDPHASRDPTVVRCHEEIRTLLARPQEDSLPDDSVPPGHLRLQPNGGIAFAGQAEAQALAMFLEDGDAIARRSLGHAEPPAETDKAGEASALESRVRELLGTGSMDDARRILQEGCARFPAHTDRYGHPFFRKELIRLLLKQQDWAAALAAVPAPGGPGGDHWHHILFARAFDAVGRRKEARAHWRQVLAAEPEHPEANEALGRLRPLDLEGEIRETAFEALPRDRPITFVQVGANDGVTNDPLAARIRSGRWRGLLVEPVPSAYEALVANYSGIDGLTFERCAIGAEPGTATFYLPKDGNTRIGSFSADHVRAHYPNRQVELDAIDVPVLPLSALLARHGFGNFDVLCVDAEGFDDVVLQSLDYGLTRPQIIHYEHKNLPDDRRMALRRFLGELQYATYPFHWNTIAVKRGSKDHVWLALAAKMYAAYREATRAD